MFSPRTSILVVDSFSSVRKQLVLLLHQLGFENIVEASDGAQAWELINGTKPFFELVFSEWDLYHSNGLDLLKRIRADGRFSTLPFLFVTADTNDTRIVQAGRAHANAYLLKPINAAVLQEKLGQIHSQMPKGSWR